MEGLYSATKEQENRENPSRDEIKGGNGTKTQDIGCQAVGRNSQSVSSQTLVRLLTRGLSRRKGKTQRLHDLTQELFVALLGKERFQRSLGNEMTEAEIEAEISNRLTDGDR